MTERRPRRTPRPPRHECIYALPVMVGGALVFQCHECGRLLAV